jgi:hypothetical protein
MVAILFLLEADLTNFNIHNNVWPVPSQFQWVGDGYHYLWPFWSHAEGFKNIQEWDEYEHTLNETYVNLALDGEYRPAVDCEAVGHAERVPGVYTDFFGDERPADGDWTAGATEPAP